MRAFSAAVLLCLVVITGASAQESDLDAVRRVMADAPLVKIEHEEKVTPAEGGKPPLKSEAWAFQAGVARPMVRYSRYLNRPPEFSGTAPSLPHSDMGVGLDGGAFGNWYRGSAIRVLLDGRDVFAAQPAAPVTWHEGESGGVRLVWALEEGRSLALEFTVPEDGHAVYARIEVLGGEKSGALQVHLTGYPGGFGPAYGLPSHRCVQTAGASAQVPRDYAAKEFPKVPFPTEDAWAFTSDRIENRGSLGLVALPEEKPAGEIRASNYGVATVLTYPPDTRRVRLGFYAFEVTNDAALALLREGLALERAALRRL